VVLLSPETERRDALNVLAADRRELAIEITTDRPLRKPRNARQVHAMKRLRSNALAQIRGQLEEGSRQAFRGHVAIELRLAIPTGRHAAGLTPVVKDYVDLLSDLVIPDDAIIEHLLVVREPTSAADTTVIVRCLPISVFCEEYDRAFRLLPELGGPVLGPTAGRRGWGISSLDETDRDILGHEEAILNLIEELDAQETEQLEEDEDCLVCLDVPEGMREFEDREVRASTRAHLEETAALSQGRQLCDESFDARDRPGRPPVWLTEAASLDLADISLSPAEGPGCFVLAAPPDRPTPVGERGWVSEIGQALVKQRLQRGRWWRARFPGPIALDIALRGVLGARATSTTSRTR
jgi:hypothetical protein